MSKMSELDREIRDLLDSTRWTCDEIADYCSCPVEMVEAIVEDRWRAIVNAREPMSPYVTCNS
jgi:hypothetical protein